MAHQTVQDAIAAWRRICEANVDFAAGINARVAWEITGVERGAWLFDCADAFSVREGSEKADVTLRCSTEDFLAIARGEVSPQYALLQHRLEAAGDVNALLRFNFLLQELIDFRMEVEL